MKKHTVPHRVFRLPSSDGIAVAASLAAIARARATGSISAMLITVFFPPANRKTVHCRA